MIEINVLDAHNRPTASQKQELCTFLAEHLDQYGDRPEHIMAAMDYAIKERSSFGGFVLTAHDEGALVGVVVINCTGMGGYIPENVLVYIATHRNSRGKGIGKQLMEKAISHSTGDIALHVEHNNPAKRLYERLGFKNPYLEMRLKKEG